MKLSTYVEWHDSYSAKTSELVRTIAFGGLAIIWVFQVSTGPDGPKVPSALIPPMLFLALTLLCDLLQYVAGTLVWKIYGRRKEVQLPDDADEDPEVGDHPVSILWFVDIFFWAKLGFVTLAYVDIIRFLYGKWL